MKKTIWLALAGIFVAMQVIQPDRSAPVPDPAQDIRQVMQPPADIQTMLEEACYDCHSYESKYPWYSKIAPVSWWVSNHISEGREKLNFSTFGTLNAEDRQEAFEEAAESVQKGEMPLDSYTWMHAKAKLSADQRKALVRWFEAYGGEAELEPGTGNTAAEKTNAERGESDEAAE